ncbi:hypothetical protein [Alienimonas chondri]|uniref:PepSY domain-containing protein n=1 Tax=Alienimonas chondri TaxID=2681879 RepID=A0ABX1VAS9_9PLAN|nr:hypothetical protein [Alienimonas chondri]NNJ24844.1 hypothetical protein [Alienimonas chondri]
MTTLARLRRPAVVLAESVAVVLAAIAVTVVLFATGAEQGTTASITGTDWRAAGAIATRDLSVSIVTQRATPLLITDDSGSMRRSAFEWEDGWLGIRVWAYRYSGGERTWKGASVPVWFLLGAGLAAGAVRLIWGATHGATRERPDRSPTWRLAHRTGRILLWSAAALGAALVIIPHPDASGWSAGLWVERRWDFLSGNTYPQLFWGADANGERFILLWRWLLAAPAAGILVAVARFVGSNSAAAGEESENVALTKDH